MLSKIQEVESEKIEKETRKGENLELTMMKRNLWKKWRGKNELINRRNEIPKEGEKIRRRLEDIERRIKDYKKEKKSSSGRKKRAKRSREEEIR